MFVHLVNLAVLGAVGSRYEQLTARKADGSCVVVGAEKFRVFTSDMISCVDLSAIGQLSPEFNDDGDSILQLCASLEPIGVVPVHNCPGFEPSVSFALQGGDTLMRLKQYFGDTDFPVIGYYASGPIDAAGTHYSIFEHEIRAKFIQWRIGVEQAQVAHHLSGRHVLCFLKIYYENVVLVSDRQRSRKEHQMIEMYRQLYAGCTTMPSEKRARAISNFVKYVPYSALRLLTSSDPECAILSHRMLDKAWKLAMFPEDVACKLLDGIVRLRMQDRYFIKIFDAYKAKGGASGEQANAIARFERELSGGAGPFSDAGVASGDRCSAFALFSECRANDVVDGSRGDGTLGDLWDGLSVEVKGIYADLASTIVSGQLLQDLKTQVEAKSTEQAQAHALELAQGQVQQRAAASSLFTCSTALLLSLALALVLATLVSVSLSVCCSLPH